MDKRFAIVIGVAATGVMALGAQTATSSTGEPVDTTPPDLQLSGPKQQKAIRNPGKVTIKVSCGDEECTAHLNKGKLTKVKEETLRPLYSDVVIPLGKTRKAFWKMTKLQQKQVRKALLDEGKKIQAKLTLTATDAAGNVASAKRTIRLVESCAGDRCGG